MKSQLAKILETSIDLAISNGYSMSPSFSLIEKNERYMTHEHKLFCHPLETVVLGEKISGCINHDIATNLGVSPQWIDGFLDGYANNFADEIYILLSEGDYIRKKYLEGWSDGEEVRKWIISLAG